MPKPLVRFLAALPLLAAAAALAHPGSGIALDRRGNVFFVDTGHGVWRLDAQNRIEHWGGPAFHWMALDLDDRFGSTRLPSSAQAEMRAAGKEPRVLISSDYPITIGGDGALYYTEPDAAWRLSLIRIEPGGARSVRARLPASTSAGELRWVNGIAPGAGGAILFTDDRGVYRVSSAGEVTTVAPDIRVPGCIAPPGHDEADLQYLRGLAEAPDGTLWIAASGCSALLRRSPGGQVEVALRAEAPWSPTAVALGPLGVYVLEYLHAPGDDRRVWVPRVRRIGPDGRVETLVTVRRGE
jgi:sugar lactone lactonase YvrE